MQEETQLYSLIETERDLKTFEALIRDLRQVHAGKAPTQTELDNAPLLNFWSMGGMATSCLGGYVSGHPKLGDKVIHTSQLYAINVKAGWARTFSRWYRLGDSMAQIQASLDERLKS